MGMHVVIIGDPFPLIPSKDLSYKVSQHFEEGAPAGCYKILSAYKYNHALAINVWGRSHPYRLNEFK